MANLRLKKSILEVVDNQLRANDPLCTKAVYEKLLDAGYSISEAKDKIGSVVLTDIYDILNGYAFTRCNIGYRVLNLGETRSSGCFVKRGRTFRGGNTQHNMLK